MFMKRREAPRHIGSVRVRYKGKRNVGCGGCEQEYHSDFEIIARARASFLEFDTQQMLFSRSARKLESLKKFARC